MVDMMEECERRWDVRIPDGCTPELRYMAHLWEPLRVMHHPLCLHLGSEVAHLGCAAVLRARGFRPFISQASLPAALLTPFTCGSACACCTTRCACTWALRWPTWAVPPCCARVASGPSSARQVFLQHH